MISWLRKKRNKKYKDKSNGEEMKRGKNWRNFRKRENSKSKRRENKNRKRKNSNNKTEKYNRKSNI